MCMFSSALQPDEGEYIKHFSEELSEDIKKYAIDEVLKFSRYIFTRREKKQQYGYCTHCKKEFKTSGYKHNDKVECPKCSSICTVKASGLKRSKLIDDAYYTYYEKSLVDPQVIVARGIYVQRDYSADYYNVKTFYQIEALYVFKMGKSTMLEAGYFRGDYFYKRDKVTSLFNKASNVKVTNYSVESIKEAVKGTQFQYSTWEQYERDDMAGFFDLYSNYPCIEYLTKLGFKEIVKAKLYGYQTYNSIHWRGKDIFKVLRINKKELREITESKIKATPLFLRLFQMSKKDKSNLPIEDIWKISDSYARNFSDLQIILKYTNLRRVDSYIKKQRKQQPNNFGSEYGILVSWRDYIADCIRLNMDLTKDNVLFPKNLYTAHQNTIKQVKLKADEELNKKIVKRAEVGNKKYYFEYCNLVIRAASSTEELINEGKTLSHCVGTYADKYASGETTILLIRKLNDLNTPFYTVEIKRESIVQVRGKKNCAATEEVNDFMEAFKVGKLGKKAQNRMKKSA